MLPTQTLNIKMPEVDAFDVMELNFYCNINGEVLDNGLNSRGRVSSSEVITLYSDSSPANDELQGIEKNRDRFLEEFVSEICEILNNDTSIANEIQAVSDIQDSQAKITEETPDDSADMLFPDLTDLDLIDPGLSDSFHSDLQDFIERNLPDTVDCGTVNQEPASSNSVNESVINSDADSQDTVNTDLNSEDAHPNNLYLINPENPSNLVELNLINPDLINIETLNSLISTGQVEVSTINIEEIVPIVFDPETNNPNIISAESNGRDINSKEINFGAIIRETADPSKVKPNSSNGIIQETDSNKANSSKVFHLKVNRTDGIDSDVINVKIDVLDENVNQINSSPGNRDVSLLSCGFCNRQFTCLMLMEQHLYNHSSDRCDVCLKPLKSKHYLLLHRRAHFEEKPHECKLCPSKFSTVGGLRRHIMCVHTDEKKFECKYCDRRFSQNCDRKKHEYVMHTKKRVYRCRKCRIIFSTGDQLKEHIKTHPGLKPYVCNICSASFKFRMVLKLHLKRHSTKKDFICSTCGAKFHFLFGLQEHETIHRGEKPFACSDCEAKFRTKNMLKRHELRHLGVMHRPFACNKCGARFGRAYMVERHIASRHGNFQCSDCDLSFPNRLYLNLHAKVHKSKPMEKISDDVSSAAVDKKATRKVDLCSLKDAARANQKSLHSLEPIWYS